MLRLSAHLKTHRPIAARFPAIISPTVGCRYFWNGSPDASIEEQQELLHDYLMKMSMAQRSFETLSQEQTDEIFKRAAFAASENRIPLASMAVEETGLGVLEDKAIKNHFASEFIYHKYCDTPTCGVIDTNPSLGFTKVASPKGPIGAITPVTNPTATAIFKSLLSLKTRNCIMFSPHPRAARCTSEAARIIYEAALSAGAPEHCVGCIEQPSKELTSTLIHHPEIHFLFGTGGPSLIQLLSEAGKPAITGGAGNTPVIIDKTADIDAAVHSILMSKTFDNGTICASEQVIIVERDVYEDVLAAFKKRNAFIVGTDDLPKVRWTIFPEGAPKVSDDVVGQSAATIGRMCGLDISETCPLIVTPVESVDVDEALAYEKLCPVLATYPVDDFEDGLEKAKLLLKHGGMGHTATFFTDENNRERIKQFERAIPTGRTLIDMPATFGAIGDLYNFALEPTLTIGCGTWGNNSESQNISPTMLLNIKSGVEKRENTQWYKAPPAVYFKPGSMTEAFQDIRAQNLKRCLIITDSVMTQIGMTKKVTDLLAHLRIEYSVFDEVTPDPTIKCCKRGVKVMKTFQPDFVVALGGGSPMDAAKIMRLLYEHPEVKFQELYSRFLDIRKRIIEFPKLGEKIKWLITIPTTSGTGSEVTPFAVLTDETDPNQRKYPVCEYALTPDMAIVDSEFSLSMPRKLTAYTGIDALVHAIESYTSIMATDFTHPYSLRSAKMLFEWLPVAYNEPDNVLARSKAHHASCIAGLAFSNAFLGVCHSMAHALGSHFHIPHGLANALMICPTIEYNGTIAPYKSTPFPQYQKYNAGPHYTDLVNHIYANDPSFPRIVDPVEGTRALVIAVQKLKKDLDIPMSIAECGVSEAEFLAKLRLLAVEAWDDQCTGTNPRFPLLRELEEVLMKAYHGQLDSVESAQLKQ